MPITFSHSLIYAAYADTTGSWGLSPIEDQQLGGQVIASVGCGSCHTIPGIRGADSLVGPPLDRMAARGYVGGVLPNTPENLVRWLRDPPGVDPVTAMSNLRLTDEQARDVAGYLYMLS